MPEGERNLNLNNAKFEITAVKPDQYPANNLPEAAFVGRSNVGKSSIINALLNRKNLARVGATPGKTREINFFNVDNLMYLVDLPGYGYASVSKEKKTSWDTVVDTYLYSRHQLKLVIMLVDIRHAPSNDDKIMYQWLSGHGVRHIIAASKADKISRGRITERLKEIRQVLGTGTDIAVVPFSSETKQGRDEMWELLNEALL